MVWSDFILNNSAKLKDFDIFSNIGFKVGFLSNWSDFSPIFAKKLVGSRSDFYQMGV